MSNNYSYTFRLAVSDTRNFNVAKISDPRYCHIQDCICQRMNFKERELISYTLELCPPIKILMGKEKWGNVLNLIETIMT